jgi:hypothetical protein
VKTCLGEHGLVTGGTAGTTSTSVRVSFTITTDGAVFTYFLVRSVVIVWDNGRTGFLGRALMYGWYSHPSHERIYARVPGREDDRV